MIRNLMYLELINIKCCTTLFDIVQIKNKVFQYWNHSYKVLVFIVIVRGVYIPYTCMYIYTYMGCPRCKILGFSIFVSSVWSMTNVSLGGMIHVTAISLFMAVERTFISKEILLVHKEDEIRDERRLIEVAWWNNGARINRMKSAIWVSFRWNFNMYRGIFKKWNNLYRFTIIVYYRVLFERTFAFCSFCMKRRLVGVIEYFWRKVSSNNAISI